MLWLSGCQAWNPILQTTENSVNATTVSTFENAAIPMPINTKQIAVATGGERAIIIARNTKLKNPGISRNASMIPSWWASTPSSSTMKLCCIVMSTPKNTPTAAVATAKRLKSLFHPEMAVRRSSIRGIRNQSSAPYKSAAKKNLGFNKHEYPSLKDQLPDGPHSCRIGYSFSITRLCALRFLRHS